MLGNSVALTSPQAHSHFPQVPSRPSEGRSRGLARGRSTGERPNVLAGTNRLLAAFEHAVCLLFQLTTSPIADGLSYGMRHRARSDSWPRHRPVGCAAECDGLEDHSCAARFALPPTSLGLHSRAGDSHQDQCAGGVVWHLPRSNKATSRDATSRIG